MAVTKKTISFKARLTSSAEASGWHFLEIPKTIAENIKFDGKFRRVVCTINKGESFQCALLPSAEYFYIIVNKKRRLSLGITAGDKVDVVLAKDESKYGLPMPEEFKEVLKQDAEGDRLFHDLTAGRQRSLIYFVISGRDVDLRIHRALIIIQHLKDNGGRVEGEKLYADIRRPLS